MWNKTNNLVSLRKNDRTTISSYGIRDMLASWVCFLVAVSSLVLVRKDLTKVNSRTITVPNPTREESNCIRTIIDCLYRETVDTRSVRAVLVESLKYVVPSRSPHTANEHLIQQFRKEVPRLQPLRIIIDLSPSKPPLLVIARIPLHLSI